MASRCSIASARLQHWNRAYMQMWQFPESFLRSGVTMDEMLDELARSGRAHRLENDDLGKPATDPKAFEPSGRWLYRRADGRLLSVRRLPIGDEGYMAICSDLTAQKQHEDELVKAWEQAVIANRSKSEFLANVSHELRTPLNAIIGFSEVVERELFGPLGNERYVSYVRDIRNSGEHLLSLINDILDLSKIEAGRFQLRMEEVDCNEIAHSVARLIRPRTVEHGLTMKIDLPDRPVVLNADKRAVKQVLINLLSNAVKFTPENGTVTLASRRVARRRRVHRQRHRHRHRREGHACRAGAVRPDRQPVHPQIRRHRPRPADREGHRGAAWRHARDQERADPGHQRRSCASPTTRPSRRWRRSSPCRARSRRSASSIILHVKL